MKIIFSRAVAEKSCQLNQEIAALCGVKTDALDVDVLVNAAEEATAQMRNVSIRQCGGEVVYEVDDKLVLMVFDWYGRVAGQLELLFRFVKPLFNDLREDFEKIIEVAAEQN